MNTEADNQHTEWLESISESQLKVRQAFLDGEGTSAAMRYTDSDMESRVGRVLGDKFYYQDYEGDYRSHAVHPVPWSRGKLWVIVGLDGILGAVKEVEV